MGLAAPPKEVVERALETIAREDAVLSEKKKERRRQAVDGMRAYGEKHHLTTRTR